MKLPTHKTKIGVKEMREGLRRGARILREANDAEGNLQMKPLDPSIRTACPGSSQAVCSAGAIAMFFVLCAASYLTAAEPAATTAGNGAGGEANRWSSFLPFMADEALKRGYELPLPFGVTAIYNYLERDIVVNDLRLGRPGTPPRSVSRFVDLGTSSQVNVAMTRFDVWLLPFVNVYGLFGYVHNESITRGIATLPTLGLPGSRSIDLSAKTTLDGFVGGGGLTLAAGYRQFFVMADANYTKTDLGFDDDFRAVVVSMRSGWNGKIADVPTRLWLGAMYWDTVNIARATLDVPGEGPISFEADQGPTHPWNASVGASVAISRHWECFAEYGFNLDDVHVFVTGLSFRF